MDKKTKRIVVIGSIVLVVLLAVFVGIRVLSKSGTQLGAKTITVDVVVAPDDVRTYTIKTNELYLRGALEDEGLVSGDESEFGLFIKTVDGVTANEANQEWWCVTKGGEWVLTGVDETPIADGDRFEITLMVGYDTDDGMGKKTITIDIVFAEDDVWTYTIQTNAATLREALEQENLILGTESEFGLFITTVDGVTANEANQEWWCITKNGEMVLTGVDETMIANGDKYELTLMTGYDV